MTHIAMTKHIMEDAKLSRPAGSQESVPAQPPSVRKRGESGRVFGSNIPVKIRRDRLLFFGLLGSRQLDIAKRLSWFVFVLSGLYLVSGLLYPFFGLKKIKLAGPELRVAQELPRPTKEPFEKYLNDISGRKIFRLPGRRMNRWKRRNRLGRNFCPI